MDSIRVSKVSNVVCNRRSSSDTGTLHLTAHHLIFCPNKLTEQVTREESARAESGEEIWIPYPLINLVTKLPLTIQGNAPLSVQTRIFTAYLFQFCDESDAFDVFESVKGLTVATTITQLYAFFYSPVPPLPHTLSSDPKSGWKYYNPREEYARMGIGSRTRAWRFTDLNKDYNLSPTYPALLCIPTRISDATLTYGAKYRSKGRIPALSYLHWNLGTITRCSQPMIGLTNSRSIQDEKLVEAIFTSHHASNTRLSATGLDTPISQGQSVQPLIYGSSPSCLIIDARPTANAFANAAKGGGTENMEYYKEGKKAYVGLENIHVMRDSLNKVCAVLKDGELLEETGSGIGATLDIAGGGGWIDRSALRRSGWLRHIAAQIEGARLITRTIHVQAGHVLIHCSDGWDRTSQLSALAQVCLDPFYRTMKGFAILLEKDWVSFGHMFGNRCGHLSSDKIFLSPPVGGGGGAEFLAAVQTKLGGGQHHLKETSPIFHQFLEATWNVLQQFPQRFEFNSAFLEEIFYHVYACQFGTFLFNCEQERMESLFSPQGARLVSVWDYVFSEERKAKFINDAYDPSLDDQTRKDENGRYGDMGVLLPDPKATKFWSSLYGREDAEMNSKISQITRVSVQDAEAAETSERDLDEPGLKVSELDKPTNVSVNLQRPVSTPPLTPERPTSQTTPGRLTPIPNSLAQSVSGAFAALSRTSSSPTRKPVELASPHRKEQSFRPFENESAFTMRTQNPASSSAISPTSSLPSATVDIPSSQSFDNRMKSMWGKFSSNATAAFSAVQDAYGGVANEFNKLNLQNQASRTNEQEITASTSTNTVFSDFSSSSSPSRNSTLPRSSLRLPNNHTNQFGVLTEDNPWATTAQRRVQVQRATLNEGSFQPAAREASLSSGSGLTSSSQRRSRNAQLTDLPFDPTISSIRNPWMSESQTTMSPGPQATSTNSTSTQSQMQSSKVSNTSDPLGVGGLP